MLPSYYINWKKEFGITGEILSFEEFTKIVKSLNSIRECSIHRYKIVDIHPKDFWYYEERKQKVIGKIGRIVGYCGSRENHPHDSNLFCNANIIFEDNNENIIFEDNNEKVKVYKFFGVKLQKV